MRNMSYKVYNRTPRYVSCEEAFGLGMQVTDNPLPEGYCRELVNFDFKDGGTALVPRGGLRLESSYALIEEGIPECYVHHTATTSFSAGALIDSESTRDYLLLVGRTANVYGFVPVAHDDPDLPMSVHVVVETTPEDGLTQTYVTATVVETTGKFFLPASVDVISERVHGMPLSMSRPTQLQYTLNNVSYFFCKYVVGAVERTGFCRMYLRYSLVDGERAFDAVFEFVEPIAITPREAVNYGYNMLSDEPYQFDDTAINSSGIILQGVLPYSPDDHTNLFFSARTSQPIAFRLYYQYPSGDLATVPAPVADDDKVVVQTTMKNGSYTVAASPDVPCNVTVTVAAVAGADTPGIITVTGLNPHNVAISEVLTPVAGSTVVGVCIFESISSVIGSGYTAVSTADNIKVGVGTLTGLKYKVVWEAQNLATGDFPVEIQSLANSPLYTPGDEIWLDYSPPFSSFAIRCTVYTSADNFSVADSVILLPAYNLVTSDSVMTVAPVAYDLSTAKGMTVWNAKSLLWGVSNAKSILFMSDINNSAYFPYPNNVQVFPEEIVSCVPYQSDLLVFTVSSIHRLSYMNDGITIIDRTIQQNLRLSTFDRNFVQVIKNMVFFRCGDAYHMIVPNTQSTIGELRLAPVSAPITNLLVGIGPEVMRTVDNVYNLRKTFGAATFSLVDGYNYLDGAVIRNVFRFRVDPAAVATATLPVWFDYILNYDADQRAWTTYIQYAPDSRMRLYRPSATGYPLMVLLTHATGQVYLQFYRRNPLFPVDQHDPGEYVFPNRQFIDTGFRDLDPQTKKRFREVQFKVNTAGGDALTFHHEFFVDEQQRISFFYTTERLESGDFVVNRDYLPALSIDENDPVTIDESSWVLPLDNRQVSSTVKVRFPVSGKGYAPRMRLLSSNETPYEYLSQNWVYRMMNTR